MAMNLGGSAVKSDINVTPLVDVVLVLLIIFMVVTPAPQRALDLGISKVVRSEAGNKQEKQERVFVRVTAANQIFLNDREIPAGALKGELENSFKGKTGQPLFLEADAAADYPEVVRILDEVSAAGVENVAIVHRERGRATAPPSR